MTITILSKQLKIKDDTISELLEIQKMDRIALAGYQQRFGALPTSQSNNDTNSQTNWFKIPIWGWWTVIGIGNITFLILWIKYDVGNYLKAIIKILPLI